MLTNTQVEQHHVAYAVGLIALAQTVVMYLGIPMKSPKCTSIFHYGIRIYYAFSAENGSMDQFPHEVSYLSSYFLDWFHSRGRPFSEEKVCIFGNCRFSAVTGRGHWADIE